MSRVLSEKRAFARVSITAIYLRQTKLISYNLFSNIIFFSFLISFVSSDRNVLVASADRMKNPGCRGGLSKSAPQGGPGYQRFQYAPRARIPRVGCRAEWGIGRRADARCTAPGARAPFSGILLKAHRESAFPLSIALIQRGIKRDPLLAISVILYE